ncbi:beta-N-acetylhexosaminidase [Segnochrobactraceae bacterium EtOH-i3]
MTAPAKAFITGLAGLTLSDDERAFLAAERPFALILFRRNIDTPDQIRTLVAEAREAAGDAGLPVLIDQEGGRVQRLGPPRWRRYPPGRVFGTLYAADPAAGLEAARLGARLIADDLTALGITVDCLPVLDVPVPGAHDIIGDRAYGLTADTIIPLARAACEGLLAGGVLPVIKHIPGHGRAGADSHLELPVVDTDAATLAATDFVPFKALADMPLAMTAHVVYRALDPERPATTSPTVIADTIRGAIGFDGLLMSDDVSMQALSGTITERTRALFAAGCDLALHCNGKFDEMVAVAAETPVLAGRALERAEAARALLTAPAAFDRAAAEARFDALIARAVA